MNNRDLETAPDDLLAPQASASTNSATRASCVNVDGISQETGAVSSEPEQPLTFPVPQIASDIVGEKTGIRKTFETRPEYEAPRSANRSRCAWSQCLNCARWYAAVAAELGKGRQVHCSIACCAARAAATGKFKGDRNPRWIGGVSSDRMRYRRRQTERWPEREEARRRVAYAVRWGHLIRLPCEHCGDPKSNGHHEDYTKPLVVIWLCRKCHDREHARLREPA